MTELEHLLVPTLRNPAIIMADADFDQAECFYSEDLAGHGFPGEYLKIVVDYDAWDEGSIQTAYLTINTKPGEVQTWPI